jgi:hypothetical protein
MLDGATFVESLTPLAFLQPMSNSVTAAHQPARRMVEERTAMTGKR